MSILSLYSKIQLKIGKAEGELTQSRWLSPATTKRDRRGQISLCPRIAEGLSPTAAWRKLRLLFWKTAKIIVRFFALIFEDSSNNFLIFTSEYESAKRLHSPKGTMEPTITFICNNSFCNSPLERGRGVLKRFQKKVRFYSRTAFAGVLICTVITTSILYLFLPGKPSSQAATY